MRCGHDFESCGSEWFQSALNATISTTPVSKSGRSVQSLERYRLHRSYSATVWLPAMLFK
jgi:hypothetical protein